jgi:hypothetical protein
MFLFFLAIGPAVTSVLSYLMLTFLLLLFAGDPAGAIGQIIISSITNYRLRIQLSDYRQNSFFDAQYLL